MTDKNAPKPAPPHIAVRPDWLALEREAPLEADLAILDAHHHLFQFPDKRYEVGDMLSDMQDGHKVTSTVFIECGTNYLADGPEELRSIGEVRFVNAQRQTLRSLDADAGIAAAMIGHADLRLGERVAPVLDALMLESGRRLRGIRNISVWHADPRVQASAAKPPPGLLADPAFRAGFACLAPRGLVFEAWLVHTQLHELHALASAFPSTEIVLNHLGGPLALGPYADQRASVFYAWREGLNRLARLPNVMVKIGGFGMPLFGFAFHRLPNPPSSLVIAEAVGPYVDACLGLFGSERCIFESNFPVDKGSFNYTTVWNAYKRLGLQRGDRHAELLLRGNAARLYRVS